MTAASNRGLTETQLDEAVACKPFDWEIRREVRAGCFRTYAHGYWRPFIVHVLGHTIIGKRKLRRMWANV